jgi:hypothetical protein
MRLSVLFLHTLPRIAICLVLALWAFSYHWIVGVLSCIVLLPVAGSFWGDYLTAKTQSQADQHRPSGTYHSAAPPKSESPG